MGGQQCCCSNAEGRKDDVSSHAFSEMSHGWRLGEGALRALIDYNQQTRSLKRIECARMLT